MKPGIPPAVSQGWDCYQGSFTVSLCRSHPQYILNSSSRPTFTATSLFSQSSKNMCDACYGTGHACQNFMSFDLPLWRQLFRSSSLYFRWVKSGHNFQTFKVVCSQWRGHYHQWLCESRKVHHVRGEVSLEIREVVRRVGRVVMVVVGDITELTVVWEGWVRGKWSDSKLLLSPLALCFTWRRLLLVFSETSFL